MDTWLLLSDIVNKRRAHRALYILKSRGMKHSNQVRELVLTDKGIELKRCLCAQQPFCPAPQGCLRRPVKGGSPDTQAGVEFKAAGT